MYGVNLEKTIKERKRLNQEELTIFLHIPKTGGTTLNTIFRNQYDRSEFFDHESYQDELMKLEELTDEVKQKLVAVSGHYYFGIHTQFTKPFNYFTILREPVDRVISAYYFLKNFPGYERVQTMTLEEFVLNEPKAQNMQTMLVSGDLHSNPSLQKAKEHLRNFKVVGVTEQFNETLFLLQKEYGWIHIHYSRKNITKSRRQKSDIPPHVIELINHYNSLDIELYEYSKQLLEERLEALTDEEKGQLEAFKIEQAQLDG